MVTDVLTRFVDGCLAEELDDRIAREVFTSLPANPSREAWERAKVQLQDLYHTYRRRNPCQASAFAALHRCIYQVYCEAYDRLDAMPVKPTQKRQRKQIAPPPAAPVTHQQVLTQLQSLITGSPIGRVVDDEPFE